MYELKPEPQFKKDYQNLKRSHPELISDLLETLNQLQKLPQTPERALSTNRST